MIKMMSLLRFADAAGASGEAHWRAYLSELVGGADPSWGLMRIVHNTALAVEVRAAPENVLVGWQAVTEYWFDSRAGAEAMLARLRADTEAGRHRAKIATLTHLLVDEQLLHESGLRPLPLKVLVFFKRRRDLTREASQAHWRGPHARLGMETYNATAFLKRYLQNHVLPDYRNADPQYEYDGSPEFWLESADKLASVAAESEVMQAIAKDEENFADRSSIETLLVREEELYARDPAAAGWIAA